MSDVTRLERTLDNFLDRRDVMFVEELGTYQQTDLVERLVEEIEDDGYYSRGEHRVLRDQVEPELRATPRLLLDITRSSWGCGGLFQPSCRGGVSTRSSIPSYPAPNPYPPRQDGNSDDPFEDSFPRSPRQDGNSDDPFEDSFPDSPRQDGNSDDPFEW